MPEYIDREKLKRDLIDNRSFYPAIVKNTIENAPTEDVVPRSEVEELEKKLNDYKKFVGEIRVTSENHAVIIDTEHTEYIDKRVAEGFKNMAVKQAKQEVARAILGNLSSHTSIGIRHLIELMAEYDNAENKAWLEGKISELCNLEKILAELKKKYIGE